MNKLKEEFLEHCTPENCCQNELVMLPPDGDVGFEEYFEHKAACIYKVKKLYSSPSNNKLMLAYPEPSAQDRTAFQWFFESPSVVARNHPFEGLFCIDISAYIGKEQDENLVRLLSFMKYHPHIVYLLMMYSDRQSERDRMHHFLSQYFEFEALTFSLPTIEKLTDYTLSGIRDFAIHIESPVQDYLKEWYTDKKVGFDYSDYLLRMLKVSRYKGDLEGIKKVTCELETAGNMRSNAYSFGY